MLIEVRRAMAEDISRVLKFYAERRYGGGIRPEDALLLAEHDGQLIGIVRLTTEEGVVVLRRNAGSPAVSTPGNREKTLAAVAQELDGKGCFCIPYAHLVGFYGGIGFHVMDPAKAPTFLRLRLEKYRDRGDRNDYLIMRREGIQEASDSVRADTSRIS